ncbi:MAG: hypothetical protein E7310_05525 [Clostridiales bacterium]|nr:hypothetical protein [Clostridiales bacterium]
MLFFHKPGIVNVRMIITEEKILSNIDKVQKMINPNSKKQIVQLDEDAFFKDLIDSIKTYLIEYPKKKNFPAGVYRAAYGLVEYATNQFEENTKKIETLIRQREKNINVANNLKGLLDSVENKEKDWKSKVKQATTVLSEDVIQALVVVGKAKNKKNDNYNDAIKLIKARISNLETNLHIEIDMERIEDRSKALSYIGIEIAEALKGIPAPVEDEKAQVIEQTEENEYLAQTRFEVKPSLWQRIKTSKLVRTIAYICKVKVVLQLPALPEGRGEN